MIEYSYRTQYSIFKETRVVWTKEDVGANPDRLIVAGWAMWATYPNHRSEMSGLEFLRGEFEINKYPLILKTEVSHLDVVRDMKSNFGIINSTIADQLMFDAMLKRLPRLKRDPIEKLFYRKVRL